MTTDWANKVSKALIHYENKRRREANLPDFPPDTNVSLTGGLTRIQLLNWEVWSMRYHVSLDFILEAVLARFARHRKPPPKNTLTLGISVTTLTGPAAKQAVLDSIHANFPNGENRKSVHQQLLPPSVLGLKYDSPEEMVKRYDEMMTQRQREFRQGPPKYKRNFRKL
jgi:hypothetical protein